MIPIFNLDQFLQHRVVVFRAAAYPANFFRLLFNYLSVEHRIKLRHLVLEKSSDWTSHQNTLAMSFLGQSEHYWINSLLLDAKTSRAVYGDLANYIGPHQIWLFVETNVALPKPFDLEVVLDLNSANFISSLTQLLPIAVNHYRIELFLKKVQKSVGVLSLDQLCLVAQYATVMRDVDEFNQQLVSKIIVSEQSLFDLSRHFLFRDAKSFYSSWIEIYDTYPVQFWLAFWSEQLFKALYFIKFQQKQEYQMAKQIGFRLPFDFMKTGWKYLSVERLQQVHSDLYKIDYEFKNGSTPEIALELLYAQFLNG